MSTWSDAYVGLPFAEMGRDRSAVDCWGLLRLVYAAELGIDLPSYTEPGLSHAERRELGAIFARDSRSYPWRVTLEAKPFDIALFRRGRELQHVGIVTSPGWMLHVEHGRLSCLERYDAGDWARRLDGVYRHAEIRP